MNIQEIKTLRELKASGYKPHTVSDELRTNLIAHLENQANTFDEIIGFEDTVIPDIERAILSGHSILLLGLRGQAKTKLARILIRFLDEYIPCIEGSEINDDPMMPISRFGKDTLTKYGDDTPITWLHRSERYIEKLATPDVSVADLIGDIDPIKAANLKLPYSDERVLHFGLVPRSHRCIFVINELPDLQARIQVSLFNILQERDLQIRGFKLRLPLDLQFVFTANPEDYTNRGSIITPLKDRIQSQILTHYPRTIADAMKVTKQEAKIHQDTYKAIIVPEFHLEILELVGMNARESEYVDIKSGVSARLSISALENLYSAAYRRMLKNGEKSTTTRLCDFWGVIPAITGKLELVYEGEQEGPYNVALHLLFGAVKQSFINNFPPPVLKPKDDDDDPYEAIKLWFADNNIVHLYNDMSDDAYQEALYSVPGLSRLVESKVPSAASIKAKNAFMELVLFGLTEYDIITKNIIDNAIDFGDSFSSLMDDLNDIPWR